MKTKTLLIKIILTLLFKFTLISVSSGQVAILLLLFGDKVATEKLHLSLDAGLNLSDISRIEQGKPFYGVNFGLGLHYNINDRWQLNPQLHPLSQKGTRNTIPLIDLPAEFNNPKTRFKLNYIEIPVMLRYNLDERIFLAAGPQIGFLSSAEQISKGEYGNDTKGELRVNAQKFFKGVAFSFPIELGYWTHVSTKNSSSIINFNVYARYCPGITPIYKEGFGHPDATISTFQLGLVFPFIRN